MAVYLHGVAVVRQELNMDVGRRSITGVGIAELWCAINCMHHTFVFCHFKFQQDKKSQMRACARACVCVGVPFAVGIPSDTITAPILFDTGASSNFGSPRFLKQAAISYSSYSATLRLADDSSAPILGKVRLRLKLQSACTVTCYVTDLCDEFDVILGNTFMAGHRAVLDYSNYTASLRRHGRHYTLTPRSILTDKGRLPSQVPEPNFRASCKTAPLCDSGARHNAFADQNPRLTDQLGVLTLNCC